MLGFARYLLSAGAATCVDVAFVQLVLATGIASSTVLYAAVIALGALAGTAINFLACRRFVFAAGRASANQIASFLLVSFSSLLLRLMLAFALIALFALPPFGWIERLPMAAPAERLAHLGAVGLVVFYSFLAHKHVSFAGGIAGLFARSTAVRP